MRTFSIPEKKDCKYIEKLRRRKKKPLDTHNIKYNLSPTLKLFNRDKDTTTFRLNYKQKVKHANEK